MKPSEIFAILDVAQRARKKGHIFNPCFVGAPGLGKTEIVQQWAKSRNLPTIILTSATLDAPEIRGFPLVQVIEGRQRMTTATPDYWPTSGEGIIVLEEVNRGSNAVMNCWMSLTDARRGFDNYKLPDGWVVVACINPENTLYDVAAMDPALRDRFEFFNVTYDRASHLNYMSSTEYNKSIMQFVEANLWSYRLPEDIGNLPGAKYVSPRTYSKLNAALAAGIEEANELEVYASILGANIAKDFYSFKYDESPVMMSDINKSIKSAVKKLQKYSDPNNYKNGMISLTVQDIIEVNTIDDDKLAQVCENIPLEAARTLLFSLEKKREDKTLFDRITDKNKSLLAKLKETLSYGK